MCSQDQLRDIVSQLRSALQPMFNEQTIDIILFGSYARNQAGEDSDIDLLILVDSPRERIAELNWQVGDAAANLLLRYGVAISPIVENRDYFRANSHILPFFRNIQREGVQSVHETPLIEGAKDFLDSVTAYLNTKYSEPGS